MKRIKSLNGYTIYLCVSERKPNTAIGEYYIFLSSDIKDYGVTHADIEWNTTSLEEAIEWCNANKT